MKVKALLITALAILTVSSPVLALDNSKPENGVLSVTGTYSEKVAPDLLILTLSVQTSSKDVNKAVEENARLADKTISTLKKLINTSAGDTIKTSNFNISPDYEYNETTRKNVLIGYKVTNQVTVRTGDIKKAGTIIDQAVSSGANNIQSIRFGLKDNNAYCNTLIEKAVKNARSQADTLSNALNVKIAGVKSASTSCASPMQREFYSTDTAVFAMKAAPTTPIEPGEVELTGNVNIDYFITPNK